MMSKLEKLCIKWLNDNYGDLERYETKKYSDYIFHIKDGNCILEYNKKSGYVYVSYGEIWSFFERMFGMDYQQIQDLTKVWVEEQYKKDVTTASSNMFFTFGLVEEQYKKDVTSTKKGYKVDSDPVEEQYKKDVITAISRNHNFRHPVEEHYKMGVTLTAPNPTSIQVEENYKIK